MKYQLPEGFRDQLAAIQASLEAGKWEEARQATARIASMEAEPEITFLGKVWPNACNAQGCRRLLQEIRIILISCQ